MRPSFAIDITSTKGFAELHSYCRQSEPDLLCIGPLYLLQPRGEKAGRDGESLAIEVVSALQRLRDEFGFAIVMETHAPKGDGHQRKMVSFGSSVYLRWPGIQLGMEADLEDRAGAFKLTANRGHRYNDAVVPEKIYRTMGNRGTGRPWVQAQNSGPQWPRK